MYRGWLLSRVLLFTGKGGVGKTSVAAATAVTAAADGARVLVTSTDPAHSLADVLERSLGDTPTAVATPGVVGTRLWAQQIDAQQRLERHWEGVRNYLAAVLAWGGVADVVAEELVLFPGLAELFALIDLDEQTGDGAYDLVVVDCAPTAETLKLLALPDALRWYAERVLGSGRRAARAVRPLVPSRAGERFPVPEDGLFDSVGRLHERLRGVHRLLTDAGRSSVRLVANPERLVLAETERTATTLALFGYAVDAVVLNRVLPDAVADPYLSRWKQRHAEQLDAARTSFAPIPVLTAPLLEDEPIGPTDLERFGARLYADLDAAAVLHEAAPVTLEATPDGDEHVLRVRLPNVEGGDVELHRGEGELHLKVAGVRRNLPLPDTFRGAEVVAASFEEGWLTVRFAADSSTDAADGPVAATGT